MRAFLPLVIVMSFFVCSLPAPAGEPLDPGKEATPGTHGSNPHGPDPYGDDPHDENHDPGLPANGDQREYYGKKDPYGNPK
jgi:hypothetical protein